MSRTKLFIQNFLVYGLGSIISKIIPLVMLPIITSIMTDSKYYGINDMVNLTISFAGAIIMMGMYDAMFRMFFEKEDDEYKKSICSTALFFVVCSAIVGSILMFIFKDSIMKMIIDDGTYDLLFFIIIFNTFLSGFQRIISAPTRMENKKKVFLVTNTVAPIISYSISIPMLMSGMFVYALPLAALSSSIIMCLTFYILNRKWFSIKLVSFEHLKTLLKIGIPLMPTFIMYWVCNSFDRVMIKSMLGLGELGIYSVASKIAHISQFIYTAFAMGWQYFAFSTMNDDDQKELITNVADYLLAISVVSTIIVTTFSEYIFKILAKGSYSEGFVIIPYLFMAPLLLMIFQTMNNQFIVIKKTYYISVTLLVAAIINIILNNILIPIYGIEGASIATLIGYIIAVIIIYLTCLKVGILVINKNIFINISLFILYLVIWRLFLIDNIGLSIIFMLMNIVIYIIRYKVEIKKILKKEF